MNRADTWPKDNYVWTTNNLKLPNKNSETNLENIFLHTKC